MQRIAPIFLILILWLPGIAAAEELVDYAIEDEGISQSLTGEPGDPERGRVVASERKLGNCLACHKIPALTNMPFHGEIGPDLAGVANRYEQGELRLWIVDPKVRNPEIIMPAFYRNTGFFRVMPEYEGKPILNAEQVEDVLAFLLTLTEESTAEPIPLRYDPKRIVRVAPRPGNPLPELISGLYFQIEESVDMQEDDLLNPGFFWVGRGRELWNQVEGAAGKSCASCHGDAETSMRGVGASYPEFHEPSGRVVNLEQRVNLCRREHMQAEPWEFGADELLAMTIFVKHQSRGMPIKVQIDGSAAPFFERGKAHFHQRRGQLDMSCAHCHDQNFGKLLRGDVLTQGHSNGYPIYALGDESARHLHKLLWHCHELMRSTPFDVLSDEFVALELFLAWRGEGLPVETPGVRW
jgi:sulfur-oxidizing protein SoxA